MNSFKYKVIIYCSQHFWKLFALSIVLLFLFSFHKVFNLLPHPVTITGIVIDERIVSRLHGGYRSGSGVAVSIIPTIEFEYASQKYRIKGGSSQHTRIARLVTVVFNQNTPQKGCEASFMGLIDFPFTYYVFFVWFFLTAFLYGTTAFNRHFPGLSLNIRNLTLIRLIIISIVLLAIPALQKAGLFLTGKMTEGVVINENQLGDDGNYHSAIRYSVNGQEYVTGGATEVDDKFGTKVPVIYRADNPEDGHLYSIRTFYLNNWVAIPGVGIFFLVIVFFGSKTKDDDD